MSIFDFTGHTCTCSWFDWKPSLSSHYPSDEVRKKSMLFPSIPDAMSEVVVTVTLEGYIAHIGV